MTKIENIVTVTETANSNSIHTTAEEIQAHGFIQGILSLKVEPSRITMRDARTYCAILLDDNNRKTLCRLYLESAKKKIEFPKLEQALELQSVADLKKARSLLFKTLALLENKEQTIESKEVLQLPEHTDTQTVRAGVFPMAYLEESNKPEPKKDEVKETFKDFLKEHFIVAGCGFKANN